MIIFTIIGIISTSLFLIKRRSMFMNRDKLFEEIRKLRVYIGWMNTSKSEGHASLDRLIKLITGKELSVNKENEENLENDVANIIKRIKAAKEDETLKDKAKAFIQKIKDELDK